jgi:hypothetical protein
MVRRPHLMTLIGRTLSRWEREEASRTRDAGEAVLAAIEPISGVRSPSNR